MSAMGSDGHDRAEGEQLPNGDWRVSYAPLDVSVTAKEKPEAYRRLVAAIAEMLAAMPDREREEWVKENMDPVRLADDEERAREDR